MIDLDGKVTQAEFGRMVGISQPAVSDLISRGVLVAGDTAGGWLLSYAGQLREVAAGRISDGDLDLVQERAGLAKEQRERLAMQNAQTRRELAPAIVIEEVLSKAGSKVAGILDAIPGTVRRRYPDLPIAVIEGIATEVAKARNIAAAVSLRDLQDDDSGESEQDDALVLEGAE